MRHRVGSFIGRQRGVSLEAAMIALATWTAVATITWSPARAGVLPFPVGIRAGVNIASLSFENLSSTVTKEESRNGGFIAGFVDFPVLPLLSIEAGLSFGEQGGKIEGSGTFFNQPVSGKATLKLVYMHVPVLAKVSIDAGVVKPYVKLGPQLGILLASKAELEPTNETAVERDTKDETETAEFSLQFGAGVQFQSGFLEVGYVLGLTGISKNPLLLFDQAKNRVLGVTAGVHF